MHHKILTKDHSLFGCGNFICPDPDQISLELPSGDEMFVVSSGLSVGFNPRSGIKLVYFEMPKSE